MSENYDEMSLEELEALAEDRKKKKLIVDLATGDKEKSDAEKLVYDTQVKEEGVKEYLEENPPVPKLIEVPKVTKEGDSIPDYMEYFNKRIELSGHGFVEYGKQEEFNYDDVPGSDAGCDVDTALWKKEDVFTNLMWHAMYCTAGLRDICIRGLDVNAGDGLKVQIRAIGKFNAPLQVSACTCLDCQTPALSIYSISILQYGLLTEVCSLDEFSIGNVLKKSIVEAMGLRWAEYFDAQIYAQLLTGFTPGQTEILAADICDTFNFSTTGCCTDSAALLFNAIIDLEATMREGTTPYSPDYLIVSPTVAAILKAKDGVAMPYIMQSQVRVEGGVLTKVGALKVIEYCGAESCASEATLAIMIDSRRAVGFAFGQPPRTEQDRNIDCNSMTIATWCYFGTTELDIAAIGHIKNGA